MHQICGLREPCSIKCGSSFFLNLQVVFEISDVQLASVCSTSRTGPNLIKHLGA
jgi:hypothetical protein